MYVCVRSIGVCVCVCKGYTCVCEGIIGMFPDPLQSVPVQQIRQIPISGLGEVSVLSGYRQV